MARSLNEARQQAAENLDRQVDQLTAAEQIIEDHPFWVRVADGAALRGIPAVGPNSSGSAITGSQPGTGPLFDGDDW